MSSRKWDTTSKPTSCVYRPRGTDDYEWFRIVSNDRAPDQALDGGQLSVSLQVTGTTPANRPTSSQQQQSPSSRKAIHEALAVDLKELRTLVGMSQKALADALHVTPPSIVKFESQLDTKLSTLRRIVDALGGVVEVRVSLPDRLNLRLKLPELVAKPERKKKPRARIAGTLTLSRKRRRRRKPQTSIETESGMSIGSRPS